MSLNVCIIVPVHNVEHILRPRITALLEVISELTGDFEIRIVDDASVDATFEVALEISREFPQITALQTPKQIGIAIAAEEEMERVAASRIFIHDISQTFSLTSFMKLWNESTREPASNSARFSAARIDQVHLHDGLQLIRRPAAASAHPDVPTPNHAVGGAPIVESTSNVLDRLNQILHSG